MQWAVTHNSLFIMTFDEDDGREGNRIATIFIGQMVVPGVYSELINHFNVLRTSKICTTFPYAGISGNYQPITDVWIAETPTPTTTPTATPIATPTATPTVTATASAMATATMLPQQQRPLLPLPVPLRPRPLQQRQ